MKIRLVSKEINLVHEAVLPPLDEDPEVIFWNACTYKRWMVDFKPSGSVITVYKEVFAFALPEESKQT